MNLVKISAIRKAQSAFAGAAETMGVTSEDDISGICGRSTLRKGTG